MLTLRAVRAHAGGAVQWESRARNGRKKTNGTYYTPDELVDFIVRRPLQPLLDSCGRDADRILAVRVVDPAMGSGHFLIRAVEVIARHLAAHCALPGAGQPAAGDEARYAQWKRLVVERCVYGVDIDPMAVDLAKAALWLCAGAPDRPLSFVDGHLKRGNSLAGAMWECRIEPPASNAAAVPQFHWHAEFPDIALRGKGREHPGFDAVIGNPPWDKLKASRRDFWGSIDSAVAARQGPSLQPALAAQWRSYERTRVAMAAFLADDGQYRHQTARVRGKRTGGDPDLYRYFIERATQLCKPGGRIALVVLRSRASPRSRRWP